MDPLVPVAFTATPVLADFNNGGNANNLGGGWAHDTTNGVFSSDVGNNNQARVRTGVSTTPRLLLAHGRLAVRRQPRRVLHLHQPLTDRH